MDFIANSTGVPRCPKCGGIIKPDVVLYEEGLDEQVLSGAVSAIRRADTLIIGEGYQRRTSLRADGVCGCNSWKKISTTVLGVGRTKTTID